MESLGLYLLKSVIWISGFAAVFFLFLRNERFFRMKRWYLVSGILISFFLPLVSVTYVVDIQSPAGVRAGEALVAGIDEKGLSDISFYSLLVFIIWLAGMAVMTFKTVLHTGSVIKTIKNSEILSSFPVKLVRPSGVRASFSFFSYVVVNPSVTEIEAREIMNHEMVHIRQKHWIDLVMAELLCIVQWFNPVAWIYLGFIRQNHEYLADEGALQQTSDPAIYKAALFNQIVGTQVISLTNSFNYSLNKKRFNMMKNIIRSPYRKMRLLLILPVCALVLFSFAKPEYRYASRDNETRTADQAAPATKEAKGKVVNDEGTPMPGAVIIIKGTTMGCVSDEKGNFRLENVPDDGVLIITYVGYVTKALKASFASDVTITLQRGVINADTVTIAPPPPPPPPPTATVKANEIAPPPPPLPVKEETEGEGDEKFVIVEEMPVFPGGEEAMKKWIAGNIKYPADAVKNKITGVVVVNFTVSKTGKIKDANVIRSAGASLDAEALRVISGMPDWKPGRQRGIPVEVIYTVPVDFKF